MKHAHHDHAKYFIFFTRVQSRGSPSEPAMYKRLVSGKSEADVIWVRLQVFADSAGDNKSWHFL
jgi:hypothetical protein